MTKVYKIGNNIVIDEDGKETVYIPARLLRMTVSDLYVTLIDMFPSYTSQYVIKYVDIADESGTNLTTKQATIDYLLPLIGQSSGGVGKLVQEVSFETEIQSYQTIQTYLTQQNYNVGVGTGAIQKTIIPKFDNSYFEITVNWFGEVLMPHNMLFNIARNGNRVNVSPNEKGLAMPCLSFYQNNLASTPETTSFTTLDKTGSSKGEAITYSLVCVSTSGGNKLYTNRCQLLTGTQVEQGASSIIIKEIAQ